MPLNGKETGRNDPITSTFTWPLPQHASFNSSSDTIPFSSPKNRTAQTRSPVLNTTSIGTKQSNKLLRLSSNKTDVNTTATKMTTTKNRPNPKLKPPRCLVPIIRDRTIGSSNLISPPPPPLPWIHVGLPKTGTTSLEHYWKCGGYNVSHHTCKVTSPQLQDLMQGGGGPADGTPCPSHTVRPCRFCGHCMKKAVEQGLPPLSSCGNYQTYAQIDTEERCYFPQLSALKEIHAEQPNATFVLLFRGDDIQRWIRSVQTFRQGQMLEMFSRCNLPYLPLGRATDPAYLDRFFCSVVKHVRRFVASHPSHALVELDIDANNDDPSSNTNKNATIKDTLYQIFGIDQKCWGKLNVNAELST